jgi:glyoxylase I family protein
MHLQGFHHVAIICSDYERSKHFYVEILGFPVIREVYRAEKQSYRLDLRVNATDQIELFSFPAPPPRPNSPEAQGLRHLAFRVDDMDKMIDYLHQHGIDAELVRVDAETGKRFTFFKDPDGLPLELYES